MAGDVDYLPLDLISRILLCLPVLSLLRLKSVCKSWLSLVESSDFVYKHLHSDGEQQQMNLLVLSSHYRPNKQQVSLFTTDDKSELFLDFPIIDEPYEIDDAKLVASCHGIICLQRERRVCLWNPATKQCTNLPPLPVVSCRGIIGFGFDPKANDYKLVTINFINMEDVFHIYSLRSDSWRKFDGPVLKSVSISSDIKTPYCDRIYCWTEGDKMIYTFDFSDEVFGNIPAPSGIYYHTLFILTKNIACIGEVKNEVNDESTKDYVYEVWMLNDYENKSWTKLYSTNPISQYLNWKTGFSIKGDFLLFQGGLFQESKHLCLYDLVNQQVTDLPVHADDDFEVVTYRESMVSIIRGSGAAKVDCSNKMLNTPSMIRYNSWGDSDVSKAAVFHILLWLPVVSLQRFKSVCKSWHSLIKSSDFVSHHLYLHHLHHKIDNFNLVLHSTNIISYPLFEDSSHHSPNTSCTCLLSADKFELLDLPIRDFWGHTGIYIATSFNGIICLRLWNCNDVYLWNPATKQFRDIVPEELPDECWMDFRIGFGFDAKTNNYKLVWFSNRVDFQVYSLSTDSWRTIHDEILPTFESICFGLDALYRNEIYCWLANTSYSCAILSFDFSNEVFGTIPLPDIISKLSLSLVLTVLRDNIVCISLGEKCYPPAENWHCEIWMMNEYGNKESWVNLYVVGPFSDDWSYKICYTKKNNEDYIMLLKNGQLYEYDLVAQETHRLPCQILGPEDYDVVAYQESLVPVKRGYY